MSPVEPLTANAFAWRCFRDALWQAQSTGFGDATISGPYVQQLMADRGVTGGARDAQMNRFRVLAEELKAMQALRSKRKTKTPAPKGPTGNE